MSCVCAIDTHMYSAMRENFCTRNVRDVCIMQNECRSMRVNRNDKQLAF